MVEALSVTDILPLGIDLFCGLGGWTEGLLAEGYHVVGFDITQHVYGDHRYPAQLVLQDVLTIHGRQFAGAALIVASPPCQAYSWRAMPWKAAKAAPPPDNALFEACFRIQQEASAAAGRHVPMVVENVVGAQKWVGRARWHYGSYYLWGDVPALMPIALKDGVKVPGIDFNRGDSFNTAATRRTAVGTSGRFTSREGKRDKKAKGSWFYDNPSPQRLHHSKSKGRKAAAAAIAKIPFRLARHIAAVYHPSRAAA